MSARSRAGIPGNERADKLASTATSLEPTPLVDRTAMYAKSRISRLCAARWKNHWESGHRSTHVLSTLPNAPSRKARRSELVREGPMPTPKHAKSVTSRLNQVTLGHCFIGEYYQRRHIPEEVACPCNKARVQTISHVLCDCLLHSEPRMLLRAVSRQLDLKVLFGTRKGLEALLSFLASSSAFCR